MPSLRFDWHERVKTVENEYRAVRLSVDRLKAALAADGGALGAAAPRKSLKDADGDLEGTYLIRLFASFESALRSYDRARHNDPDRETKASVLIDGRDRRPSRARNPVPRPPGRPRRAPGP